MIEYEYIPGSITALYYEDCCKLSDIRADLLMKIMEQEENKPIKNPGTLYWFNNNNNNNNQWEEIGPVVDFTIKFWDVQE